jgi:hypothetical protein
MSLELKTQRGQAQADGTPILAGTSKADVHSKTDYPPGEIGEHPQPADHDWCESPDVDGSNDAASHSISPQALHAPLVRNIGARSIARAKSDNEDRERYCAQRDHPIDVLKSIPHKGLAKLRPMH